MAIPDESPERKLTTTQLASLIESFDEWGAEIDDATRRLADVDQDAQTMYQAFREREAGEEMPSARSIPTRNPTTDAQRNTQVNTPGISRFDIGSMAPIREQRMYSAEEMQDYQRQLPRSLYDMEQGPLLGHPTTLDRHRAAAPVFGSRPRSHESALATPSTRIDTRASDGGHLFDTGEDFDPLPPASPHHQGLRTDNPFGRNQAQPEKTPKQQSKKRAMSSEQRGTSRKRGRSTFSRSTTTSTRPQPRETSTERDVETEGDEHNDREERTLSAGRGSTRGRAKTTRPVGRPKKLQKETEVPKDPVDVDAFCDKIRWPSLTQTQKEVIQAGRVREATLEKTPPKPRKSMRNVGAVEEQTEETESERLNRSRREDRKAFQARKDQETLSIHPFAELDQDVQNVIKDAILGLDTSEDIMSRLGNAPCKSKDVGICLLEKDVSKGKRMVQELGLSCTACHKFPLPRPCLSGREEEDGGLLMVPTGRTVDVADPKCWM
ncbi:hypothetical protein IWX49DRAFT_591598 [Phyllosticta citricarpa]|uniref:Uncharacterized protein n=2 Tax=Phyllosticta TaxID=121621 RepID=A0ABR1MAD1_9PEZI